jgi:hypothetical protein
MWQDHRIFVGSSIFIDWHILFFFSPILAEPNIPIVLPAALLYRST